MFSIDYDKFLMQLTPGFLRRPKFLALMKTFVYPVKELYNLYVAYRAEVLYDLSHNGQVFSLENVLNDRFDNDERRIYITDGLTKERVYIYKRVEDKPFFLPKYIHTRGDYADTGVDFIVWVPNAIVITLEEMYELRAKVNRFKLDPKRYKVYRV